MFVNQHRGASAILGRTLLPTANAYQTAGNANRLAGGNRIAMLLCPSFSSERSSSTIDNTAGGLAYTTHYVGNAGPIGTNPATGAAYGTCPSTQGPIATDGVLSIYPSPSASKPAVGAGVALTDITDGTSSTFMVFESAWTGLEIGSFRAWPRGYGWNNDGTSSKNVANAMRTQRYTTTGTYNNVSMGSNHSGGCNICMSDGSVRFFRDSIDLNRVMKPLASRNGGEVVSDY